jgi:hypothetical protein
MSKKHIKLDPHAGHSADELWAAAKPVPVHTDGGSSHATIPESHLIVTTADGRARKIAVRATEKGELLVEFDI